MVPIMVPISKPATVKFMSDFRQISKSDGNLTVPKFDGNLTVRICDNNCVYVYNIFIIIGMVYICGVTNIYILQAIL